MNPNLNLEPMPSEAVTSYTSNINSHNISKLSNHTISNNNINNQSLNQSRIEQDINNNNISIYSANSLLRQSHDQINLRNNISNNDQIENESNGILSPIINHESEENAIGDMNNVVNVKDIMDEFKGVDSNITFQDMNNEESRFGGIHKINDIERGKELDNIYNLSLNK